MKKLRTEEKNKHDEILLDIAAKLTRTVNLNLQDLVEIQLAKLPFDNAIDRQNFRYSLPSYQDAGLKPKPVIPGIVRRIKAEKNV